MFKDFTRKLPLILTFCLFNSLLPAAATDVCSTENGQGGFKIAQRYNQDGDRESNGRAGRDGRSGQNQTISAGSPVNLDLSGTNGEDGEDGENASRPRCGRDFSKNANKNINAPDGGNGGNGGVGGKGGDGGNGGSLTVYYTNLADLKTIFVRAVGGESGRGGRGGQGTAGCNCHRRSWEEKTCTGTPGSPNYKCTNTVYRCYNGRNGNNGSNGPDGKRGSLGTLSIINSQEPLVNDTPTRKVAISQLGSEQLTLSKNKWLQRQGAVSLLAAGSIIADEYREFERRLEGTLKLIWQEKQPIANFANQTVILSLNNNQQIEIAFPEDMWVDSSAKVEDKVTEFTVNYVIPQQEVTKLAVSEFADAGQNLNLKLVDLAGKSDLINTQFKIKYRARDKFSGSSDYQTFYEGDIPVTLITREYNRFTLALGKLKMPSDAVSSGTNVEIEVVAIRSLGERSAQQNLRWQGTIRKSK
ncbi:collagen-like protein [Anabaena sp. UHCC 0451]|uniref:collagen-like protein n=1 Tax=Anabaena sp. UHCC 0451 TaxID=2055235 RepID=UPI002B1F813F|nr:collagen-like protein [Anabaena sp. UHCC 0451]MEA5578210.1 collagen-like protein [Anabaena sp. UHCC 0451]